MPHENHTLDHYAVDITNDEELHYHAHVLRFWKEHDPPDAWRFSLEDVQTGERRGFADLDALMAFLRVAIAHDITVGANAEEEDE